MFSFFTNWTSQLYSVFIVTIPASFCRFAAKMLQVNEPNLQVVTISSLNGCSLLQLDAIRYENLARLFWRQPKILTMIAVVAFITS